MWIKENNRLLLFLTVMFLFVPFCTPLFRNIPTIWNFNIIILYVIVALVGIVILQSEHISVSSVLPYNKELKWQVILLLFPLTFLMMPITNKLSALGAGLFGDVLQLVDVSGILQGRSFPETLFIVAVIPAFFEELFFRGFFYSSFRKARGPKFAILMTSILFGLFHGNFQQAIYATAFGIIIAILRELTGSMWAGTLVHFINNSLGIVVAHLYEIKGETSLLYSLYSACTNNIQKIFSIIGETGGILLCLIIVLFILYGISKTEEREREFCTFFSGNRGDYIRVVTLSLVLSIALWILTAVFVSFLVVLYTHFVGC